MSTSPTLEGVVKQSDERSPQLDLPPPPPLPSASSSPSKVPPPPLPPSSFIWPFSDPSLVFYIDEFSSKAESLRKNLERRATASGLLFRITTAPTEASHVVLDSNCSDNASLRSLAPPQHVVSLDWLKDSFFEEKGLEEEEYSLRREQGTEQAEEAEGEEDEDEDAFVGLPAYASHAKGSWIVKEEKEFIRFLASDPQRDAEGRSIFRQYQRSHPSRTVPAYNSYYFKRKDVLDAKVAKLKAASNGQPIVYEHPKIVQEELDEKSVGGKENEDAPVPFVKTRADPTRASPTPPSVPKASKSQCPRRACSNCDVHQATSWHRIKGRDECWFCRSCYDCWRRANQTNPGSEDRALARKRRPVLGERAVDSSDLSELEDSTSDASSDSDDSQSRSSSSSEHAVLPKSFRSEKRRGREKAKEWTKEEEDDLVRLLARRKGSLAQVWRSFSVQHPRRSSESTRKRHGTHRARFNQKVAAFQRKEGKKSTRPAAVSESEELEDDESMGGEEEAEESSHPKTSTSISSPKRYAVDRKRPQEPEAESSKRRRVEAPFTAVASSSHPSSSNHHHHYPQQQQHSSFPSTSSSGFASGSNYSLNQPRPPLPSFSRRVASASSSSSTRNAAPSSSHYRPPPLTSTQPAPPLQPPPPLPEADSSSEEELEPSSFLELGVKPSSLPPSSPFCFFCGESVSDTFKELSLAAKNPATGEVQRVRARLACDVCESSWEKRVVKGKKLGVGVAEMGELERLAWVTEVLIEKGLKVRERRVKGWNWAGGR